MITADVHNSKNKSAVIGKLSKSSTSLSISSSNINENSHLEYNRITPLPAATTNAPFEQTFRITVLLPKDQLYVTRLSARVPLSKLLELVCDNKLLDMKKYEFRNPVDPSQVYSCDLSIGAVGLSEIRLCHKTDLHENFDSEEIPMMHRTTKFQESLSSSKTSSQNLKNTTKTTSLYSSTNSLNSVDSLAVSCNGRSLKYPPKLIASPRKKRAAPRPPKKTSIHEKSTLLMKNNHTHKEEVLEKQQERSFRAKDLSVSTPNLFSSTQMRIDINGNDFKANLENFNDECSCNGPSNSHGYSVDTVLYAKIQKSNAENTQNHDELENCLRQKKTKYPEPSPRKRTLVVKKKTIAPPAPPISKLCFSNNKQEEKFFNSNSPTPLPRITTTSATLNNATHVERGMKILMSNDLEDTKNKSNVSKVILNRSTSPEPHSLSCEPPEEENCYEMQLEQFEQKVTEEDCISKQADSGIEEPVDSHLPDSLSSEVSKLDVKVNHFESSSDDDDTVKVYNFKLGQTLIKPVCELNTLEEFDIMNSTQEETDSELNTPLILAPESTPNALSETSSWNFSIPISPPPNFADNKFVSETQPDTVIKPKIIERPILNFEVLKQEPENPQDVEIILKAPVAKFVEKTINATNTSLENIVQELSHVTIKKTEISQKVDAENPNTLRNFTVLSFNPQTQTKPKEVLLENYEQTVMGFGKAAALTTSSSFHSEEEKLYCKRSSVPILQNHRFIIRSDSLHSIAAPLKSFDLKKRTSSQLSIDQTSSDLHRRRYSSELSIGELPSLESLQIIKIILNSRKNSLANSSSEEEKEITLNVRRPSEDLRFANFVLKSSKTPQQIEKPIEFNLKESKKDQKKDEEQPAKDFPKMYRYSGPPCINFTTWVERPKSKVAIKNEGDYIFGGGGVGVKTTAIDKINEHSLNNHPSVALKVGPTKQMGVSEIFVKPLKNIVIEKQKINLPNISLNNNAYYGAQSPTVETVLKSQKQSVVNTSKKPSVEQVLRPQTQIITTLPRIKQKYSTPFSDKNHQPHAQLLRSNSITQTYKNEIKPFHSAYVAPGPQILRSFSTERQGTEKSSINTPVPFGQNSLKHTGYKEKILRQEEKQQQKIFNMAFKETINENPFQTSAKLHIDLKKTCSNANTLTICKTLSPSFFSSSSVSSGMESPRLNPSIHETAAVLPNAALPPIPPAQRSLNGKHFKFATTPMRIPSISAEPRNELLLAIRNFNKGGLKKLGSL